MSKYSKDDIIRMVEEEDVEFIRLQFTDIFGMLKNVAINRRTAALRRWKTGVYSTDRPLKALSASMSPICIFTRIWTPLRFFPGVLSRERWRA